MEEKQNKKKPKYRSKFFRTLLTFQRNGKKLDEQKDDLLCRWLSKSEFNENDCSKVGESSRIKKDCNIRYLNICEQGHHEKALKTHYEKKKDYTILVLQYL